MKKISGFDTASGNLSPREAVLSNIGAECGRCGFKGHTAPLVVRAEGLSQNRKKVNYHHYWMQVAGLALTNPGAIEILCRNCLAIEMEGEKNPVGINPTVYVYPTNLPEEVILRRWPWLDELPEPKEVYIVCKDKYYKYQDGGTLSIEKEAFKYKLYLENIRVNLLYKFENNEFKLV